MNKVEAAAFLEISERSLERYTAQNRIGSTLIPGKTRKVVDYDPVELQRFKRELSAAEHRGAIEPGAGDSNRMPTNAANGANTLATLDGVSGLESLLKLLQGAVGQSQEQPSIKPAAPIEAKLLLSLAECQALTGLSRGTLREAIDAGTLKAQQIGRSWRVKRSDLETYIEQL